MSREIKYADSFDKQFTVRGIIIGIIGSIIITMSSMYIALKASSLPWPIIFVALISMLSLKILGHTNINEINVTHTIMSAGAMVAGGLAFTIPGIWMLGLDAEMDLAFGVKLLIVTLCGVILGVCFTMMLRRFFIEKQDLPYPMGQAAADTLIIGDQGGKKAGILFGAMALSGIWTFVRDWLHKIPALFTGGITIPGGTFGIYMSPMMISVGYIIGPLLMGVWFLGAIIGNFLVVWGGTASGIWDLTTACGIRDSLGIGVMVGCGIGIILKGILPQVRNLFKYLGSAAGGDQRKRILVWLPLIVALLACVMTFVLDLGLTASLLTIIGVWLTTAMSAQILGQTGINPMEIFGVIVLLACRAVSSVSELGAFFVAAIVAVACGLVGDVMNDFKVGHIVHSDPKAQIMGEAIGGIIGAFVSVGVLFVLFKAYGAGAFGDPMVFPAAQAGVVASMVKGIANVYAFAAGLLIGCLLYIIKMPVMTLGLGIYLPFYLSLTAFIGGLLKFIVDKARNVHKNKYSDAGDSSADIDADSNNNQHGRDLIIASGLMGGEAVIGVIIALIMVCLGINSL